jgi:hypothetical protein
MAKSQASKRQLASLWGQVFVNASDASRRILETLYRLRNHVEHLRDPRTLLRGISRDDPEREAFRLAFQAENLSSHICRRLLDNPNLLPQFRDDTSISVFWGMPEDDIAKAWGPPAALDEEVRRFHGHGADLHEIGPTGP